MHNQIKNQYVFFLGEWSHQYPFKIRDAALLHQLGHVLHRKQGDTIWFMNGRGEQLSATIQSMNKYEIMFEPLELKYTSPLNYSIHLAIGTPKKESLKDILKYTTQLGVSSITLVDSVYSQCKATRYWDKLPYYHNIITESLEQSLQPYIPQFNRCESWEQFFLSTKSHICVADLAEDSPLTTLLTDNTCINNWTFCIGPEGGWSPQEADIFKKYHLPKFQLSKNILRVETAAITSVVIAQSILSVQTPKI